MQITHPGVLLSPLIKGGPACTVTCVGETLVLPLQWKHSGKSWFSRHWERHDHIRDS